MKKIYTLVACALCAWSANAQWSNTTDALNTASTALYNSSAVAVSTTGETYVSGNLSKDGMSFGETTLNFLNLGDSFILKYSATGEPVNAAVINGATTHVTAMTLDNEGNLYVAGTFKGTALFTATDSIVSGSVYDEIFSETTLFAAGFVAKYDATGAFVSAVPFAPAANESTDVSFIIHNLQWQNGKLYAAATYSGDLTQDGFAFKGFAFDPWGIGYYVTIPSGAVFAMDSNLAVTQKVAEVTATADQITGVSGVSECTFLATDNNIYALFGAFSNSTLQVGSSSEAFSFASGDDNAYGYILADVTAAGALTQAKSYESALIDIYRNRNEVIAMAKQGSTLYISGLTNLSNPFDADAAAPADVDLYVAKIDTNTLAATATLANVQFPNLDVADGEYIVPNILSGAAAPTQLYSAISYGLNAGNDLTLTAMSVVYNYETGAFEQTNYDPNEAINGYGSNGSYLVSVKNVVTDVEFDEGSLIVTETVEKSAGINQAIEGVAVTLFPNPAVDVVMLSECCDVVIYNAQGAMVQAAQSATELSVAHLASGVYHVVVTPEDEKVTTLKLIKK